MPPATATRKPIPIDGGPKGAREQAPTPVPEGKVPYRYAPNVMGTMLTYAQLSKGIPEGPAGRAQREALGAKLDVDLARAEMKDGVRFNDMSHKDLIGTANDLYAERSKRNAQKPDALANPNWAAEDAKQRQMQVAQDVKTHIDIAKAMLGHEYPPDNPIKPGTETLSPDRVNPVTKQVEMGEDEFVVDSPVKSAVKKYMAYKQKDGTRTVGPARKLTPGEDEIKSDAE